jgi:predicted phage terminase large subunit-like protein
LADEIYRLLGRRSQLRIELIRPAGDKVSRLNSCVPVFENGIVFAPDRDWADAVIQEIASFPRGRHDDYVDSSSMAIRYLRESGVAVRRQEHEFEVREKRMYRKQTPALYDV